MSEAEKQEGQKTVVAFITGLLIGGLLVWVFSSSPESQPTDSKDADTTTEESAESNDDKVTAPEVSVNDEVKTESVNTKGSPEPVEGDGTITVSAQKAGESVSLGETKYPEKHGWVVVRDYANGASGNILGAARYNLDEGLLPTSVGLLRNTEAGKTYQVSFFADNGDKTFSKVDDAPVTGGEATFTAN